MKKPIKHKTHHYVDVDGNYLGGFGDGALPNYTDAVRVDVAPNSGDDAWNGTAWVAKATSTNSKDYTHTRRQFRDLLTSAQETEIESAIKAETKPKIKRALRNWWNHTAVYEWDDREMVKMLTMVTPETASAIEAAWIAS